MDFQLAFTKEYRKNSLITKAHETTLVRKKNTSQELFKSPYTLWEGRLDKLNFISTILCKNQFQKYFHTQPSWKHLTIACASYSYQHRLFHNEANIPHGKQLK